MKFQKSIIVLSSIMLLYLSIVINAWDLFQINNAAYDFFGKLRTPENTTKNNKEKSIKRDLYRKDEALNEQYDTNSNTIYNQESLQNQDLDPDGVYINDSSCSTSTEGCEGTPSDVVPDYSDTAFVLSNETQATECDTTVDVLSSIVLSTECDTTVDVLSTVTEATECDTTVDVLSITTQTTECDTTVDVFSITTQTTECDTTVDVLSITTETTECDTTVDVLSTVIQTTECDTTVDVLSITTQTTECDTTVDVLSTITQTTECDTTVD
ncbi:hypothetical protein BB560_005913, partial [Smittium megazygosporum]